MPEPSFAKMTLDEACRVVADMAHVAPEPLVLADIAGFLWREDTHRTILRVSYIAWLWKQDSDRRDPGEMPVEEPHWPPMSSLEMQIISTMFPYPTSVDLEPNEPFYLR